MRRLAVITAASALVFALVPASALARHHHKRHHARVHHRLRVRHERFGNVTTPPATSTTPTTPGTPPPDAVGTVDSFTNGMLIIKLNNGSSVSGTVDQSTEFECESASPVSGSMPHDAGDGGGDQSGSGNTSGSGGDQTGSGDQSGSGDNNGSGGSGDDDQSEDQGQNSQSCTTAGLTPGAFVRGAELKISSAGAVWDKVDLIL